MAQAKIRYARRGLSPSPAPLNDEGELSALFSLRARTQPKNCPLCRAELDPAESLADCSDCATLYHEECLTDLGGCATLGCSQKGIPLGAGEGPARTPPTQVASRQHVLRRLEAEPCACGGRWENVALTGRQIGELRLQEIDLRCEACGERDSRSFSFPDHSISGESHWIATQSGWRNLSQDSRELVLLGLCGVVWAVVATTWQLLTDPPKLITRFDWVVILSIALTVFLLGAFLLRRLFRAPR
jgi:hypothetical protein